jgi:hypothetical protein
MTKLLGYDFVVEYKKGVDNRVADALSRKETCSEEFTIALLSVLISSWIAELKQQYTEDEELQQLLEKWNNQELDPQKYSYRDGLFFYKHKILSGQSLQIKAQVLASVHSD